MTRSMVTGAPGCPRGNKVGVVVVEVRLLAIVRDGLQVFQRLDRPARVQTAFRRQLSDKPRARAADRPDSLGRTFPGWSAGRARLTLNQD